MKIQGHSKMSYDVRMQNGRADKGASLQTIGCLLTFFSMEHKAKLQPWCMARLQMRASIHSDFPELGTPVTMESSPGTTWKAADIHHTGVTRSRLSLISEWHDLDRSQMTGAHSTACLHVSKKGCKAHGGAWSPCSNCPPLSSQWTWHGQLCPHCHTGSRSHPGSLKTCR